MRMALAGAVLVAGYWTLLFLAQRSILYPAPSIEGVPARPSDALQVWLPTDSGNVEAWLLSPGSSAAKPAPLLLFTHGNGELIDFWPFGFKEARRSGMAVLLVEYPGYGRSAGRPSQDAIAQTILAAYDWARDQPGIDADRIIPYGRSLGGGAACILAAHRKVPALILESSFTSVRAFAFRFGAPGFLVRDPFDNLAAVRAFQGPILILHGDHDEVIPTRFGLALAAASARTKLVLLPCAHNDCFSSWPHIHAFLEEHRLLDSATADPLRE